MLGKFIKKVKLRENFSTKQVNVEILPTKQIILKIFKYKYFLWIFIKDANTATFFVCGNLETIQPHFLWNFCNKMYETLKEFATKQLEYL